MDNDELDKVELPAITQLEQLGWTYVHGAQLAPEAGARAYQRDVVLINQLESALACSRLKVPTRMSSPDIVCLVNGEVVTG